MSYVCPELANANDHLGEIVNALNEHAVNGDPNAPYQAPPMAQRGANGANVVLLLNQQERIFFPHVDSCIAIIFQLNNGMVVGGHAGTTIGDLPEGEIGTVIDDMIDIVPQSVGINEIHLYGDINGFNQDIDDFNQSAGVNNLHVQDLLADLLPGVAIIHHQMADPINVAIFFHDLHWDSEITQWH